jgi:hypothetical protein
MEADVSLETLGDGSDSFVRNSILSKIKSLYK